MIHLTQSIESRTHDPMIVSANAKPVSSNKLKDRIRPWSRTNNGHRQESASSSSLDNYELGRTIGVGNFAKVKIATHIKTGKPVAVKIVDRAKLKQSANEKLTREIKIMKQLNHPNIVKLFEVITQGQMVYLVMELVNRGELYAHLYENGRMRELQARRIMRQLLSAVEYCHRRGIVHRDLKAENILLDDAMNVKLADFGFANHFDPNSTLSTFCGSPPYAAPELFKGTPYVGPEVDVWSLGIVLYKMVAGCLPFNGQSISDQQQLVVRGSYKIPYFMSKTCEALLRKMLKVKPHTRAKLETLFNDAWICHESEGQLKPYEEKSEELKDPYRIYRLNKLGYSSTEIRKSLEANKYNAVTTTYKLLDSRYSMNGIESDGSETPSDGSGTSSMSSSTTSPPHNISMATTNDASRTEFDRFSDGSTTATAGSGRTDYRLSPDPASREFDLKRPGDQLPIDKPIVNDNEYTPSNEMKIVIEDNDNNKTVHINSTRNGGDYKTNFSHPNESIRIININSQPKDQTKPIGQLPDRNVRPKPLPHGSRPVKLPEPAIDKVDDSFWVHTPTFQRGNPVRQTVHATKADKNLLISDSPRQSADRNEELRVGRPDLSRLCDKQTTSSSSSRPQPPPGGAQKLMRTNTTYKPTKEDGIKIILIGNDSTSKLNAIPSDTNLVGATEVTSKSCTHPSSGGQELPIQSPESGYDTHTNLVAKPEESRVEESQVSLDQPQDDEQIKINDQKSVAIVREDSEAPLSSDTHESGSNNVKAKWLTASPTVHMLPHNVATLTNAPTNGNIVIERSRLTSAPVESDEDTSLDEPPSVRKIDKKPIARELSLPRPQPEDRDMHDGERRGQLVRNTRGGNNIFRSFRSPGQNFWQRFAGLMNPRTPELPRDSSNGLSNRPDNNHRVINLPPRRSESIRVSTHRVADPILRSVSTNQHQDEPRWSAKPLSNSSIDKGDTPYGGDPYDDHKPKTFLLSFRADITSALSPDELMNRLVSALIRSKCEFFEEKKYKLTCEYKSLHDVAKVKFDAEVYKVRTNKNSYIRFKNINRAKTVDYNNVISKVKQEFYAL